MPLLMCPNCQVGMKEVTREGVQMDVCPQCRGVWLDRGELETFMGTIHEVKQELERDRTEEQVLQERRREQHVSEYPSRERNDVLFSDEERRRKRSIADKLNIFD